MRALRPLGCEFPLKYTPAPLPIKGKNSSSVSNCSSNIGPGLVIIGLVVTGGDTGQKGREFRSQHQMLD